MNHLLRTRHLQPYPAGVYHQPSGLRARTSVRPPLSSYSFKPYVGPLSPYHPPPISYTYSPAQPQLAYLAINPENNHHDRIEIILIAILILVSLDIIFVRPYKKN